MLGNHSAEARAWLEYEDRWSGQRRRIELVRVGSKSVVAKAPSRIGRVTADLVVTIGGREDRVRIKLSGFRGRRVSLYRKG